MFSTDYLSAGAAARREMFEREARTAGRARAARRRRASVAMRARQAVNEIAAAVAASRERAVGADPRPSSAGVPACCAR